MKQLTEFQTDFIPVAEMRRENGLPNPDWRGLRASGQQYFERNGLPGKRDEDWKYTSLWSFSQQQFTHDVSQPGHVNAADWQLLSDAYQLVIVDGHIDFTASSLSGLPDGVTVQPLSQSLDAAMPYLNQQISLEKSGFNALNTMLMSEGAYIHVAAGVKLKKPIELLVVNSGNTADLAVHLRHVVVMEAESEATLIELYASPDDTTGLTNSITEIDLADRAKLFHYKLQRESKQQFHIATMAAKQAQSSEWHNHNISLGGQLARNDVHSQLLGEQAHVTMNGLYLVDGRQHVDNHTRIDHTIPNTTSDELYKGVMDDKSHAVFNGKVHVHRDAQKTDANQANKNLLLSRGAEIDSKPEMEIYADDVKCGHGSAIGQINEDQLFFLRARGLSETSARSLLTFAFAADVIEQIDNTDIRDAIIRVVEQRLPRN
ncbi:Iron-sulfur cluster assembly protein SufD [Methylophaga frappieri]|uniref:Iron-sulfur cluster assembly protein SufD n=1 Tax=Methylophaga frappieri (strain ATCC BAA-2434 / DSM 25690 / JAM7) TaxID=754477 RepID=I1YEW1_METFJ|nr:Fe-S cluster assembly protein SufD [Methylophaga frappieri]AFJ01454.1 Iron-sulfur cluster assembly protein SufD [Methylophaga frappieri]